MPSDSMLYLAKRTKLVITAVLLSKPFLTKQVYSQSCMLSSFFLISPSSILKEFLINIEVTKDLGAFACCLLSVSVGSVSDTTGKKTNSPLLYLYLQRLSPVMFCHSIHLHAV